MPYEQIDGQDNPDYLYEMRLDALIDELVSGTNIDLEGNVKVDHNQDLCVAVFEHEDFNKALIEIAEKFPKCQLYDLIKIEAKRLCENALDDEKDYLRGAVEDDCYDEDMGEV